MAYPPKIERALEILENTGMWRSSYAPPLYRLLWSLGISVRPPLFNTFWGNFLTQTLLFGVFFMAIMGLLLSPERPPVGLMIQFVGIALVSGLITAAWLRSKARKHNLPAWSEIDLADRFD